LTGHWNDRPNSPKNKSTDHQRKTPGSKSRNNPSQDLCRGIPLNDRATTGTTQQLLHDSRTCFVLSVPCILLTFHLAALRKALCPGFVSAQMLRDTILNSSSRGRIPPGFFDRLSYVPHRAGKVRVAQDEQHLERGG
jgi:hypothetical protein